MLIHEEEILRWADYKDHVDLWKKIACTNFLKIYNKYKSKSGESFKWGDELEYTLVKFDHENKKAYLSPKAVEIFKDIDQVKSLFLSIKL